MSLPTTLYIRLVFAILILCSAVYLWAFVESRQDGQTAEVAEKHSMAGESYESSVEAATLQRVLRNAEPIDLLNEKLTEITERRINKEVQASLAQVAVKNVPKDRHGVNDSSIYNDLEPAAFGDETHDHDQESLSVQGLLQTEPHQNITLENKQLGKGEMQPKVAIVIDDLGMSAEYTEKILAIDFPLTLAFIPVPLAKKYAEMGHEQGQEIIIHMPMEALGDKFTLQGGIYLKEEQTAAEMKRMLSSAFDSFDHYVGMNNHMGSKFTQDGSSMRVVMKALKKRDLFFLDSRTIGSSVGEGVAKSLGVPTISRDVFLDNGSTKDSVLEQLEKTEAIAKRTGMAVAIGHGRAHTVEALQEWLPLAKSRGVELVFVSDLIHYKEADKKAFAAR